MNHIRELLFWAVVVIGAAVAAPSAAAAAELVMIEEDGCPWCERWERDIGVVYHKTVEGRRAPLLRVDIHDLPGDLEFATRPRFTPTFVLFDDGVELGRIEGHPGEDFFWPMLDRLLARLPEDGGDDGS